MVLARLGASALSKLIGQLGAFNSALKSFLFLACSTSLALANQGYVTDDFEIMFRAGPTIQSKILKPLRSGTVVEVIDESAGNGHSQVRTADGQTGYVLTRFISDQVPARTQLAQLQSQIDSLVADPEGVQRQLLNAQEERDLLIEENMRLTTLLKETEDLLERLDDESGGVLELSEQNQNLNEEIRQLLLQLDDIRIQNDTLKDTSEQRTMALSAALIVLGLFLGWLLSRTGGRRRTGGQW